jgi:hypothetical protein
VEQVKLHFKTRGHSWDFVFMIVDEIPVTIVVGIDFFKHSGLMYPHEEKYWFHFATDKTFPLGKSFGLSVACQQ